MQDLVVHLDRVNNASSVEALWRLHQDAMASYGFDRLLYGYTRYRSGRSLGDPQDWVVLTNFPSAYMRPYIEDGLYANAPMIRWALENDGACSWSWLHQMVAKGAFTPPELKVLEFNRKMGITAGYTISFRSVSQRAKGGIGLCAHPGMPQDEVDALWTQHGPTIQVMNNVFHLKLLTLPYSGARQLTQRQREVLQWVGDGKTAQDIALLMGLTAATVEKHLRLAREALDVETTAQAVLKAAFYNQMFTIDA
ncbi:LuxR family transcriptional regulator [Rubellimicrobium roseum]|uniref:LuxR family transcriptional regulator n=2 Tax=Rubellimicrobium roseum TaxID=687525 RepID=A0A5C4NDE7_9RHOB|nr:LuxR family transcriptional regulator [Rubellimicrobium roseum]